VLILTRMATGSGAHGGFSHVGYLFRFYFFYPSPALKILSFACPKIC
jgi:hypothetical protein